MKNTNMIRFTRGAVLAGLVLGSSMTQAWGNRSIALPKVMSNVAAKSVFSNYKLALGLGVTGVALTASAIVFARYFKQTDDYQKSTGKLNCLANYFRYVGNKTVDATFATGRGMKAAARWIGYQASCHKYCKPVAAPLAKAAEPNVAAPAQDTTKVETQEKKEEAKHN